MQSVSADGSGDPGLELALDDADLAVGFGDAPGSESHGGGMTTSVSGVQVLLQFGADGSYQRVESSVHTTVGVDGTSTIVRVTQQLMCTGPTRLRASWASTSSGFTANTTSAVPLSPLTAAFSLPLGTIANLTLAISGCGGMTSISTSSSVLVLRFGLVQLVLQGGTMQTVLVDPGPQKWLYVRR
jgi:hypothetical protein